MAVGCQEGAAPARRSRQTGPALEMESRSIPENTKSSLSYFRRLAGGQTPSKPNLRKTWAKPIVKRPLRQATLNTQPKRVKILETPLTISQWPINNFRGRPGGCSAARESRHPLNFRVAKPLTILTMSGMLQVVLGTSQRVIRRRLSASSHRQIVQLENRAASTKPLDQSLPPLCASQA